MLPYYISIYTCKPIMAHCAIVDYVYDLWCNLLTFAWLTNACGEICYCRHVTRLSSQGVQPPMSAGTAVFSPGLFSGAATYAFNVGLPLMWEGNQLMWSQTPPKPCPLVPAWGEPWVTYCYLLSQSCWQKNTLALTELYVPHYHHTCKLKIYFSDASDHHYQQFSKINDTLYN